MESYNGWSNYETWRIALEVFDGYEMPSDITLLRDAKCHLEELAEEVVLANVDPNSIAHGLLVSFLSEVNYWEIAEHMADYDELQDIKS